MWILPVIAILFAGGQIANIVNGTVDVWNLLLGGAIAALALGYYLFFRGQRQATELLIHALALRREELEKTGQVTVMGNLLKPDDEVGRFSTSISFVLVTISLQSRYFLPGESGARAVALSCSLGSLLFGWWAVPWGPVYTIHSLVSNSRGGSRISVMDLANESNGTGD
jgi:hypothetical protein